MSYNFNVILIVILMFYMVCALLIISVHFPFTSKPQRLYGDFRRRYLHLCGKIIRSGPPRTWLGRTVMGIRLTTASALLQKMAQWGAAIDNSYFPGNSAENIHAFNHSCENLLARLKALTGPMNPYADNPLAHSAQAGKPTRLAADLCDTLAEEDQPAVIEQKFAAVRDELEGVEEQLNTFLDKGEKSSDDGISQSRQQEYSQREMANFYVYINLQASILANIDQCRASLTALDWRQLRETKF